MSNLRILFCLLLLVATGCASLQNTTTAADRLCHPGNPDGQYCYHRVKYAEKQAFDTHLEAVRYGLAYLLHDYPDLESAGFVLKDEKGKFRFEFATVGEDDQVNFGMNPKAVAWVHTHIKGTRNCSARDQHMTLAVNQYLGRKVYSYVQHKYGNVVECKPQRAPKNDLVPRFGQSSAIRKME